jgi:sulfate adenylyltransferase subunit 1
VIVAVNKMDLVDYSEVYNKIKADFEALNAKNTQRAKRELYSVECFNRNNVVEKTDAMPWYKGQTILEHLEALEPQMYMKEDKLVFGAQ